MVNGEKFGFAEILAKDEAIRANLAAIEQAEMACGEQQMLSGLFGDAENANLGAVLPTPQAAASAAAGGANAGAPRGKGRPVGSANKSTAAWSDYLISRYGSPLEHLTRLATRDKVSLLREMKELSREFGLKMPDRVDQIFDLQTRAAAAALPYLASRMPIAVEVETTKRTILQLGTGGSTMIEGSSTAAPVYAVDFADFSQHEENQ